MSKTNEILNEEINNATTPNEETVTVVFTDAKAAIQDAQATDAAFEELLERMDNTRPKQSKSQQEALRAAINEQTVCFATVEKIQESSDRKQVITATLKESQFRGIKVLIPRREADMDFKSGDLFYLLNEEIPIIITGYTKEKYLIGSRRMAQQILKDSHLGEIMDDEVELNAKIMSYGRSGAFLTTSRKHGYITGFLRDSDYSSDFLSIEESKQLGSFIRVRVSSVSKEGRVTWEAVNKAQRTEPVVCLAEKGSSCEGVIKSIATLPSGDRVFVKIQKDLDVSCPLPTAFDINEGDKVYLKILDIRSNEGELVPKVRGVIVKVK